MSQRVGTFSLREGLIFQPCVPHDGWEPDVSFDTARLVINPILLVALFGELLLHGPRTRPHRRIFDGDLVFERLGTGPRPALDQMQILARTPVVGFGAEIRHVDDETIS